MLTNQPVVLRLFQRHIWLGKTPKSEQRGVASVVLHGGSSPSRWHCSKAGCSHWDDLCRLNGLPCLLHLLIWTPFRGRLENPTPERERRGEAYLPFYPGDDVCGH